MTGQTGDDGTKNIKIMVPLSYLRFSGEVLNYL